MGCNVIDLLYLPFNNSLKFYVPISTYGIKMVLNIIMSIALKLEIPEL